jgi:hypothetical protein
MNLIAQKWTPKIKATLKVKMTDTKDKTRFMKCEPKGFIWMSIAYYINWSRMPTWASKGFTSHPQRYRVSNAPG